VWEIAVKVMSRYKGQAKPALNERDFPALVVIPVPDGGFGNLLDQQEEFHFRRGLTMRRGRGRRDDDGRFYVSWCFADAATADAWSMK
jgi:hypothetical protein